MLCFPRVNASVHCTVFRLERSRRDEPRAADPDHDENLIRAVVIEDGLRNAGHRHVSPIHNVSGISRRISELEPDVVVIDLKNPNRDMQQR